jgi:hypothetical protein
MVVINHSIHNVLLPIHRVLRHTLIQYVVLQEPQVHKDFKVFQEQIPIQVPQEPKVIQVHKDSQVPQEHKDFKVFQEQIPIQVPQEPKVIQVHKDSQVPQEHKVIQEPKALQVKQEPKELRV